MAWLVFQEIVDCILELLVFVFKDIDFEFGNKDRFFIDIFVLAKDSKLFGTCKNIHSYFMDFLHEGSRVP